LKPIHLNLAAKPYRDYRPYVAVVVVASVLTAFLALQNVDAWLKYQHNTRTTRAAIDGIDRQIRDEQRRADAAAQRLRSVDTKLLSAQAAYVNARLAERAFSWSELLDRLERVLPDDVRIESIAPTFNRDGMVHLILPCYGKSNSSMVTTIDRLNHDPQFSNAFPSNEDKVQDGYRFNISVDYKPSLARPVDQ
jgi:Tfp pilus assembly protein PilN